MQGTIKKEAAGRAVLIVLYEGLSNKFVRFRQELTGILESPEAAFERMSDWLEEKKIAFWVMVTAVVYIAAQIIRAVLR
ncbi:hypothetical protein SDD30_15175 [Moorella naiadis]|uniref:hypothetical protein n=1 Tax=Moorella naiadis (nom. illeg.) TaxID=3093670 RepID=UPI003D9C99F3